jgi:hypothetical protein
MSFARALKYNGRWQIRATLTLALIGPLYVIPLLVRTLLNGWGFELSFLLSDMFGCFVVGVLANNFKFAVWLYLGCSAMEGLLLYLGNRPGFAFWIGDLIPAMVAIYFAQQLYINMGD